MAGIVSLLINFLVLCIILGIVYWICATIIGAMGMPWGGIAIKILGIVCLLIMLLWFLSVLEGSGPLFYRYNAPLLR